MPMATSCHKPLTAHPEARPAAKPCVPAWLLERNQKLHRQFKRMLAREAAGKPLAQHFRVFAWYWRQRCYRNDPQRRVEFCVGTLERLYRRWKQGGFVAYALLPRWRPTGPAVPLATMQRFGKFYGRQPWPNVKVAWAEFSRRRHSGGPGRPRSKPRPISHGQVYYAFRGGWLAGLQARVRALEGAQSELSEFQLRLDAMLRERLSHRPQRKRRTAADRSLEAACL